MLEKKIEQWKQLKRSKALIEGRIADLRKEIEFVPDSLLEANGVARQKRNRTTLDEFRTWELMDKYGIPHYKFIKKVIDPDAIEQLYWDGILSDADLRHIRLPRYTYALVETGGEDVQEQSDDLC